MSPDLYFRLHSQYTNADHPIYYRILPPAQWINTLPGGNGTEITLYHLGLIIASFIGQGNF
jgi:hypothetical protein